MTLMRPASAIAAAALLATAVVDTPANAAEPTPVTLAVTGAGVTIRSGDFVTLTISSFRAGTTSPEQWVSFLVQERALGTTAWYSAGSGQTRDNGQLTWGVMPKEHTEWRVVVPAHSAHSATVSAPVTVRVNARLAATSEGDLVERGYPQKIIVLAGEELEGRQVTLWRRQGSAWKKVRTRVLVNEGWDIRRTFPVSTKKPGRYRYRATIPASSTLGAGASDIVTFKVA